MGAGGEKGLVVDVALQPRASKDEVASWDGETLKVRVTAPPVDGKANDRLVKVLAKALGIARSRICIAGGAASRRKRLVVDGISDEDLEIFRRAAKQGDRR